MARLRVEQIRAQARGIDDPAGAQLTDTVGSVNGEGRGVSSCVDAGHPGVENDARPARECIGGERQRRRPGADDRLPRHDQTAAGSGAQGWDAPVDLVGIDEEGVGVAVGLGLGQQARQRGQLLLVPRHQHRADRLDRDPGLLRIGAEQLVAAAHHRRLHRAGRGIEAGVQDRGVRLARGIADVTARLDEGDTQGSSAARAAGDLAGDGTAHHSGTDDDDVGIEVSVDVTASFAHAAASRACCHRASVSAARSADHCGSTTAVGVHDPTACSSDSPGSSARRASAAAPSAVASGVG